MMYTPVTHYLARPLWMARELRKADVIVVLAGGVNRNGTLQPASLYRTIKGAQLYRQRWAPKLMFSGGLVQSPPLTEARSLAGFAMEWGAVPARDVLLEERSGRTHESAVEVAALMRKHGLREVLLVTSPLHLYRAVRSFRAQGVAVFPVATDEDDLRARRGLARLHLAWQLLREYAGLGYYWARGWLAPLPSPGRIV